MHDEPPGTAGPRRPNAVKAILRRHGRLLGVIAFLAALAALFDLSGIRGSISLDYLRQTILMHKAGGMLLFVLMFSLGNFIQIPGLIFLAAAVLALGEVAGGVATYAAACVSCAVTFLVIRYLGGDALRRIENPIAARIFRQLDARPVRSMSLLRLLFQTAPALNYALALSSVRFRDYLVATLIGLPLPIALYCVFFDYVVMVLNLH